jgi:hypothetical protein
LSEQEEIQEIVEEAKSPKTFSIINVLTERAYPKTKVSVSLDEATAYDAAVIKERIDELARKDSSVSSVTREISELNEQLSELVEKMAKSTYTFHVRGISEGKREEILAKARKKYPVEYEAKNDIASILSNNGERTEKPSPERDSLFTDLLWAEHLEMIEDPDGNIQEVIGYTDVRTLRHNLPLSALAKINSAIERVRTATAVFMMETGEDFLAKP